MKIWIKPYLALLLSLVILVLFFATGIILFMVGEVQAAADSERRFPGLIGVGFGFIGVGIFCCTVEGVIIRVRYRSRLKNAIAAESIKYSNRLPTPCSWRLHTTRVWNGRHDDNSHTKMHDYIIIDIGQSTHIVAYNSVRYYLRPITPLPTPAIPPQDQQSLPPPYSQVFEKTCSQCGVATNDVTMNFCSFCGGKFDRL